MYTRQQTFDTAVRLTVEQGGPSTRDTWKVRGECAYRGDNGRRCTVGLLIPDAKYTPMMEGTGANMPLVANVLREEGHDSALLAKLQYAHDIALVGVTTDEQWLHAWADEVRAIAAREGLFTDALDEALTARSRA